MPQVRLVSDEYDDEVAIGEVSKLLQPLLGVLERGIV